MDNLQEEQYTLLIIYFLFLLRMGSVSDKEVEKVNIYILFSITPFFFENLAVDNITWKKYCRAGQTTDENMAHAHCLLFTES
jgi:hypothetical protein